MSSRSMLISTLALVMIAPPVVAQSDWASRCAGWNNGNRETHCEERESRIPARGTLSVDAGQNGGVSVEGWNESGILVQARIQAWAPTEVEAREIARQVQVETGGTLRATGPSMRDRRGWAVSWKVFVPRSTGLELETRNGGITVEDVAGRMQLDAQNGPINLTSVAGDVRGRTVNGPINVTLRGSRWTGTGLDVQTTNGPVILRLPRGYSAELETGTVHGPMNLDLDQPIPVRGRITRRIQATLGQGGPPIRAVTTNGPVTIRNP